MDIGLRKANKSRFLYRERKVNMNGYAYVSYSPSSKQFRLIQRMIYGNEEQQNIEKKMEENIKAHNSGEIIIKLPEKLLTDLI